MAYPTFGELAVARLASEHEMMASTGELAQALGFELPTNATPQAIRAIRTRLRDLAERWRSLEGGAAIKLPFSLRTT